MTDLHARGRRMGQSKVWISVFILLVIGLHAVPLVSAGLRKKVWPFLEWTMYNDSRPPGPIEATKKRIIGVTANGTRVAVTPQFLGSSIFALQGLYGQPMLRGDSSAARKLFKRLNFQRDDPFVELRVESERYTVTDSGVVKRDNPVVVYRASLPTAR
jgi:hypothetical protein